MTFVSAAGRCRGRASAGVTAKKILIMIVTIVLNPLQRFSNTMVHDSFFDFHV